MIRMPPKCRALDKSTSAVYNPADNVEGGILMKAVFLLLSLFVFALPANADTFNSIGARVEQINAQLQGNHGYHANMARQLASVASTEDGEHDIRAALRFIELAEAHAAQAGASK